MIPTTPTPCPPWCHSTHTGPHPGNLRHHRSEHTAARFTGTRPFTVTTEDLGGAGDGLDLGPQISLHTPHRTAPPLGLTITEARALAAALHRAAEVAAAQMPQVCTRCAEPCHHHSPGLCFACTHLPTYRPDLG